MTQPAAKVLLDSITGEGDRITTVELTHHRFILAETNTHGAISKNSASSRAIPLEKMLEKFELDPAYPVAWRAEQGGMTAGGDLTGEDADEAYETFRHWNQVTSTVIRSYIAILKFEHGEDWKEHCLHKSWLNRLLEPMQWHTALWTFDHNLFKNFLNQRLHPDAQPEFYELSKALMAALDDSEPNELQNNQWHMPLLREEDKDDIKKLASAEWNTRAGWNEPKDIAQEIMRKVSVARCARVSYLTHDGVRDISKDLELHDRLAGQDPPHASPFEHVCTPAPWNKKTTMVRQLNGGTKAYSRAKVGKFYGWLQMRHAIGMP